MIVSRFSIPIASRIALLNRRTPSAAIRAPEGWALKTTVLPAASMLIALPARVGRLCVTGVMAPIDAERGVVGQGQAAVARVVLGAEVLDPRDPGDRVAELGDLVVEPADLGLLELQPAELLGLLDADLADAVDRLLAVLERAGAERLEGRVGRRDGVVGRRRRRPGCPMAARGLAIARARPRCPSGTGPAGPRCG